MPALAPVLRCADRRCTWQVRLARDMWISAVQRLSVAETVALYDTENVRLLGTVDTEGEWVLSVCALRACAVRVAAGSRGACGAGSCWHLLCRILTRGSPRGCVCCCRRHALTQTTSSETTTS